MALPSPQIAIGLLFISIGIVVTFDIKIDLFQGKEWEKKLILLAKLLEILVQRLIPQCTMNKILN